MVKGASKNSKGSFWTFFPAPIKASAIGLVMWCWPESHKLVISLFEFRLLAVDLVIQVLSRRNFWHRYNL